MTAKEFIQSIAELDPKWKGTVNLSPEEWFGLMEAYATEKIGWLDYPEHTPDVWEELIVWDGSKILDNCFALHIDGKTRVWRDYDCDHYEIRNVTKFMYLKNLKPE